MKANITIWLLFVSTIVSPVRSATPFNNKKIMIEQINNGFYEKAIETLMYVDNWEVTEFISPDSVLSFVNFARTKSIRELSVFDSLYMYIGKELDLMAKQYIKEKEYDRAISIYEFQAEWYKAFFGENNLYALSLYNVGFNYVSIHDYYSAEKFYKESLKIYEKIYGLYHNTSTILISNIGFVYSKKGDYQNALDCYLKAFKIEEQLYGSLGSVYATTLNNIGYIYSQTGDFINAERYYLKALERRKNALGELHPYYAASLTNIGMINKKMGNYEIAEKYYLKALEIYKKTDSSNSDYVALLNNLAQLYGETGEHEKAHNTFMILLDLRKKNNKLEYSDAILLNNIGAFYHSLGDISQALEYYQGSLEIKRFFLDSLHISIATSLHNIACCYRDLGNFIDSEKLMLQSIETYKNILGSLHPDYITALHSLGVTYTQHRDYHQAYKCFDEASDGLHNHFSLYVNYMIEQQREKFWLTIQKHFTQSFSPFVYLYHFINPTISTFAYNNELFCKGILLSYTDAVHRSVLESGDSILISLWDDLTSIKQTIMTIEDREPQSPSLKHYRHQADSLEKIVTQSSAAYRENQAMWQITWDSVQNHLSSNDVAIEYFSAPLSEDSIMYCALLLRNDSKYPELIPLFEEKEVSSFLSSSEGNITNQTYDYYANGETISQLVWSKILPKIKEGETIYFAPSGLLHQLAIEYLPYDENRTMSDVYNMVRLSSTRETVLNKQNAEYTTATIYGGIAYDLEEDVLLAESENYATENLLASRSIENDTLNRGNVKYLPGTKKEAESINTLLKQNNISAKLYTTAKANEESFKSLSGKHSNILHIGTHGFTWTDSVAKKQDFFAQRVQLMGQEQYYDTSIDPLNRCGLLFAGANIALQGNSKHLPKGVQDGILTAKEISLMDLRDANLVVLSACETAKGDITSEGVFGLQRAFKMAGVQTIIMSLWKVNDQATQLLMIEFYNNWIGKHQSKREAFRNAQNTVRSQYEEPEYWAGFIMLD